jgi:KR domain/Zinc-binding dehydrogenase
MSATSGKGVDVILNFLTGDLLDESWRCIADGGTMVEIGKRDMLDRNNISMEPFNRNASYRAIDMSHKSITRPIVARLISQMFQMIAEGQLKPISPIKIFSFHEIADAFRYMRSGLHIGKIVISDGPQRDVQVPTRAAPRRLSLRSDVCYLIVGGLKGLCGSLAIYLARHGARHLVVVSRSGYQDKKSLAVLQDLDALGTQVDLAEGDVSKLDDVQRVFQRSTKPIGGVIQGAMVLRVKLILSMISHRTDVPRIKSSRQ